MENETFNKELKRGTLEMVLLRLISERQMYGYELASTLEKEAAASSASRKGLSTRSSTAWKMPVISESRWETLERGVPRKYYQLTKPGKKYLQARSREWKEFFSAINKLMEGSD